jgi:hypothetical protein
MVIQGWTSYVFWPPRIEAENQNTIAQPKQTAVTAISLLFALIGKSPYIIILRLLDLYRLSAKKRAGISKILRGTAGPVRNSTKGKKTQKQEISNGAGAIKTA